MGDPTLPVTNFSANAEGEMKDYKERVLYRI